MHHLRFFLFLCLLPSSAVARPPDTAAGLEAHYRQVQAQARRLDRLIARRFGDPRMLEPVGRGLAYFHAEIARQERKSRAAFAARGELDALYFRTMHEGLDLMCASLRSHEQAYAAIPSTRGP